MSNPNSSSARRPGFHYGWVVVGVAFITSVTTAGLLGLSGIMLKPLEDEFHWQSSDVSVAFGLRLALFGLLGPFAAALMNRFGVRRMMVIALSVILLGLVGTYGMHTRAELLASWGLATGVGIGLMALVLNATVATRWFVHRRGLVVGLLSASSATGQLIFLPLLARVAEHNGWRQTIVIGGVAVVVCMALVLAFMRNHPADVGLTAYGETEPLLPVKATAPDTASLATLLKRPLLVLREAAGVPLFWLLFITFFICGASTNGLIQTHFIPMCGDFGILPTTAAGVLAMMGVFDLVGTIGSGWLSDRFDPRWLLVWYYGLRGLSLVLLPFTDFSFAGLSVFAVFYGLDWIATVPPTLKLTVGRFGIERTNVVFGWIFAGHQLGAAVAAYGAGVTRTLAGSYLPAFFVSGVLCFAAAAMMVAARRSARIPAAVSSPT